VETNGFIVSRPDRERETMKPQTMNPQTLKTGHQPWKN
jgi:hypothetical protein